ncbi:30S ribosomal protein S18 [Candidatus Daviesbacteria bacterium]|nr:30S ribosomal protein S18 [Candidatus Daviesbacteria bacterium]
MADSVIKKKTCFFCDNSKEPAFTDSASLRRFMSDRSRINPKQRSGVCSKHQRGLSSQIKYARHLAMLPFITRA